MRVLLVGEFSGFFTSLKDGLTQLGHEVRTLSGGDSWKGFKADWPLYSSRSGLLGKVERNVALPLQGLARAAAFRPDVVQFINPLVLAPPRGLITVNRAYFGALTSLASRSYLVCAGDDAVYWRASDTLRYSPKSDQLEIDYKGIQPQHATEEALRWNIDLAKQVNGIIPIAYDYALGYQDFPNIRSITPLPFATAGIPAQQLDFRERLKVYHGITRPGFKGTRYILEAFDRLKTTHGDTFEFVVEKAIPYKEYIQRIATAHVLVDQTNSYCYGMNAILGMAAGKVVLSGAEPEVLATLPATGCPIINITPDARTIETALAGIAADRDAAAERAASGPRFVAQVHEPVVVARRFVELWSR